MPTTAKTFTTSSKSPGSRKTYEVALTLVTGKNTYGYENAKAVGTSLQYVLEDNGVVEFDITVKEVENAE